MEWLWSSGPVGPAIAAGPCTWKPESPGRVGFAGKGMVILNKNWRATLAISCPWKNRWIQASLEFLDIQLWCGDFPEEHWRIKDLQSKFSLIKVKVLLDPGQHPPIHQPTMSDMSGSRFPLFVTNLRDLWWPVSQPRWVFWMVFAIWPWWGCRCENAAKFEMFVF